MSRKLPGFVEKALELCPWLNAPVRYGFLFSNRWDSDACSLMAAALAFFGLLSVFPLALAGVAILARVLANNHAALQQFIQFVGLFFPGNSGQEIGVELEHAVRSIASGPNATTLSLVALGTLIWSGRAYFDTLATVLSRIWPGARQRNFWKHQTALWGLMSGAGILFFLSTVSTFALSVLQSLAQDVPGLFINRHPAVWNWAGKLAAWLLTLVMFYLLYHFGPNCESRNRRSVVWSAAFLAAVAWELAKLAFTHFVGNVARYQAMYGSVAGIVVTMMWMYISSLIILFGAEAAATYDDMKREADEPHQYDLL